MSGKPRLWYAEIPGHGVAIVRAFNEQSARDQVDELLFEDDIFNAEFELEVFTEAVFIAI
jgi:hypothetical protein